MPPGQQRLEHQIVQTIERHVGFYIGFSVFVTLDPDDNPRILYGYNIGNNGYNGSTTVKYTEWNNASNWVTQTVVSNICEGGFGNLALDSKGYPHFTYATSYPQYTSLNTTLTYISWNGSAGTHKHLRQKSIIMVLLYLHWTHKIFRTSTTTIRVPTATWAF